MSHTRPCTQPAHANKKKMCMARRQQRKRETLTIPLARRHTDENANDTHTHTRTTGPERKTNCSLGVLESGGPASVAMAAKTR